MKQVRLDSSLARFVICVFSLSLALIFHLGCATPKRQSTLSLDCLGENKVIDLKIPEVALNQISEFYDKMCFEAVIAAGTILRDQSTDKVYEISSEVSEAFSPEGTWTTYVLESHERTYLSILMAASFYKLNRWAEAEVELRKSYDMSLSKTYNQGEDLPTILLQAVLWERLKKPDYAYPLWRRAAEWVGPQSHLAPFLARRMEELSQKKQPSEISVYGYGEFPSIDWRLNWQLKNASYYQLRTLGSFPASCVSKNYALVPTESWYHKLELRYAQDYHPLVNIKSWVRLPVGATYALLTGAAGVGVGLGGCVGMVALTGGAQGASHLCEYTFALGHEITKKSPKVLDYTLRPDLRHWEKTPMAFIFVDESAGDQLQSTPQLRKEIPVANSPAQCQINHLNHVNELSLLF